MHLSQFIEANMEQILEEWEAFARTLLPSGSSRALLRDDAEAMLHAIAKDIETPQSVAEQQEKSRGQRKLRARGEESAAQRHGVGRQTQGLDAGAIIAEFRALRASGIRLWT